MSYNKGSDSYDPPTGAPPNWSGQDGGHTAAAGGGGGYTAQSQPQYNQQTQDRGYGGGGYGGGYQQQGYQQQGYQQGYQQGGYPPQQGGYYNAQPQQPMYVQQQRPSGDAGGSCLMACLAALCVCCTLDMLF